MVCTAGSSCVGAPFINSSIDFNRGEMHHLILQGDPELIEEGVISIMNERGASLIRHRETSRGSTVLSFRTERERERGRDGSTVGLSVGRLFGSPVVVAGSESTVDYVEFGGLFYVELASSGETTTISVLGLPVVDGVTACPSLARQLFRVCEPAVARSGDFAEVVFRTRGVSVDGAREAEFVRGVFAELQRKKWRDLYAPRSASQVPEIGEARPEAGGPASRDAAQEPASRVHDQIEAPELDGKRGK